MSALLDRAPSCTEDGQDGLEVPVEATLHRTGRDLWDVLRWTRSPLEAARAVLPLPEWLMGSCILNSHLAHQQAPSPTSVSTALRVLRNILQAEALSAGGVDYVALRGSRAYEDLKSQSALLVHIDPARFRSDSERVAFWLNLYNVLSLHGVIALGIRRSPMEVPSFFARVAYRVGTQKFTLDDISNGVLRRGSARPGMTRPQFSSDDPRAAYWPQAVDPRIHGALVCASASCPPAAYYSAERLDQELDIASAHFVSNFVRISEAKGEVHLRLPLHFYYYATDFGGPKGIAAFILRHADGAEREGIRHALAAKCRIRWDPYDWGLNANA